MDIDQSREREDTGNWSDCIHQCPLHRIGLIEYLVSCTVIESGLVDLYAT